MEQTGYPPPQTGPVRPMYTPAPKPTGGPARVKIVAAIAAVAIGLTGGALWAGLGPAPAPEATEVALEPVSFSGTSPFLEPVGQDRPEVAAKSGKTAGTFAGNTAGLYASGSDKPSCDAQALITALRRDPSRAKAWAAAQAIPYENIDGFVGKLAPVVLRSDTAVTSFGYDAPKFFRYPAVLQAGTAVFVTTYGEPKVKCFSGNPLSRGAAISPRVVHKVRYAGRPWSSFKATTVTLIRPTTQIINNICFGGNGGSATGGNGGPLGNGGSATGGDGGAGCVFGKPDRLKEVSDDDKDCDQNRDADGCKKEDKDVVAICALAKDGDGCRREKDKNDEPVACAIDPNANGCTKVGDNKDEDLDGKKGKNGKDGEDEALNQPPVDLNPVVDPKAPVDPNPVVDPKAPVDPNPVVDPRAPVDPNPPVDPKPPVDLNPVVDPKAPVDLNPVVDPRAPVDPNGGGGAPPLDAGGAQVEPERNAGGGQEEQG